VKFEGGREDMENDPRSGQLKTQRIDVNVDKWDP
jgi:hypothetical protein